MTWIKPSNGDFMQFRKREIGQKRIVPAGRITEYCRLFFYLYWFAHTWALHFRVKKPTLSEYLVQTEFTQFTCRVLSSRFNWSNGNGICCLSYKIYFRSSFVKSALTHDCRPPSNWKEKENIFCFRAFWMGAAIFTNRLNSDVSVTSVIPIYLPT